MDSIGRVRELDRRVHVAATKTDNLMKWHEKT